MAELTNYFFPFQLHSESLFWPHDCVYKWPGPCS